jgi:succinate dehydrogenase/fumarate reductase cytochrome b subunit
MKNFFLLSVFAVLLPNIAYAAPATDFMSLMQIFLDLLGRFMTLLYAAAFVAFFWGIVKYIWNTDDTKGRADATNWMVWSVVALFVMVTLWGIVGLLVNTFGMTPTVIPGLAT